MANNEETYKTNASALELATALVDEDNIEELEPILQDSLDEINEKEFLCPECNKKYKIETGRNRHVLNK
jgi:acetone carboxylase gamma subunit